MVAYITIPWFLILNRVVAHLTDLSLERHVNPEGISKEQKVCDNPIYVDSSYIFFHSIFISVIPFNPYSNPVE